MLRNIALVAALAGASMAGACYTESTYADDYSGGSDLAYVAPGVSVMTDYDYPVFYTDNSYWLYNNGSWYSSPYWYGGWSLAVPPVALLGIYAPWSYAHYRPYGYGRGYYGHYGHGYYGHGGYYGHRGYYGRGGYYGHGTYHGGYHGGTYARPAPGYHGGYRAGGYHGGSYRGGGYHGGGYHGGGYHGGGSHGGGGGYHGGHR